MTSARLFVAAEIPAEVRRACSAFREEHAGGVRGARWTRAEAIHLTFVFLGATDDLLVPQIASAIGEAAAGAEPLQLVTGAAGLFGGAAHPRVLWIGCEGDIEAVSRLAAEMEKRLTPLGYAPSKRPYRPHLTLARLDPDRSGPIPERLLQAATAAIGGCVIPVAELVLFQSHLEPGGARYVARARIPIGERTGATT